MPSTLPALLLLLACKTSAPAAGEGPPPPEVGVVTVAPGPVELATDLPGRVEAARVAEVRARVAGIVLERRFTEGSDVVEGQELFRIDPAPLRAALQSAEANVARAEARALQAAQKADRLAPLVESRAISQQDYDDALAARAAADADVAVAKAALTTARLQLGYATVTAPIAGRIGRAEVSEGALVGQGTATRLAVIQQLDTVYVNLSQSGAEVQRLRRALAEGVLQAAEGQATGGQAAAVTILHEDGSTHPEPGHLLFTDVTVDPTTGAVQLRAQVPNPGGQLLPGEFVRARLAQAQVPEGIAIPRQAVARNADGATVLVLDAEDKVAVRPVTLGAVTGESWLVTAGLAAGDRVIVDGLQKARPGKPVRPVPWP